MQVAVGTMNFGKRTSPSESERVIARALERGLRVFDTANAYTDGESERILGRALRSRRDEVSIASKVGFGRIGGKPEGLSRAVIARAIDGTLERLGTDYVDVYYLHVPDHATPIEESLDAMAELVDAKKVRAWGVSNYGAWQILEILHLADARKMPRPTISQVLYNPLIRELDVDYFAFAKKYGIHTTIFNPLAGGLLTGKHARGGSQKGSRFDNNALYQRRYWTDAMFDRVDALRAVADAEELDLVGLAYAWAASRPGVDSILAGPADVTQLDAAIDGCEKRLSAAALARIDELDRTWRGTDTHYVR